MIVDFKTFIYAGFFVSDDDKEKLKVAFCENIKNGASYLQDWKTYIDHCTMIFNDGNFDDAKSENIINYLEDIPPETHMYLTVDGIGRYENVFAFRIKKTEVVSMLIKNKQPHITCVLNPSTNKPVDSNKISEWKDIKPIRIDTVCKIFNKSKKK